MIDITMEIVTVKSKLSRRNRKQLRAGTVISQVPSLLRTVEEREQVVVRPPGQGKSKSAKRRRRKQGTMAGSANVYLSCLMDPENSPGCRIPDMVTIPSSTYQLTIDGTISPSGTGDGVLVLVTPDNFFAANSNANPIQVWNNTTPGGNYVAVNQLGWAQGASIAGLFDQFRPVSGVLYGEFIGNSATDAGQICMGWLPRVAGNPILSLLNAGGFGNVIAQAFTKSIPLRNGAVVRWKPQDNQDLEYTNTSQANSANASGVYRFPSIYFATSGQATTAAVRYRCVFNFEAIPTSDTALFLAAETSTSNLSMLESAMNWTAGAYNNLSAFVGTVSPYVQPVLGRFVSNQIGMAVGGALSNRGNSLRLQY